MKLKGLDLIKTDDFAGYESKQLQRWLEDKGLLEQWSEWALGNTGGIVDGKFIVYEWDLRRFLGGRPNTD